MAQHLAHIESCLHLRRADTSTVDVGSVLGDDSTS